MAVMDPDRWRVLEPLLDEALDLSAELRADWLEALRTTSPDLAADLTSLLADDSAAEDRGFLAAPTEISLAGVVVGAYTLERPLGHGGMGSVWLARRTDGRFEGRAAVKLLNLALLTASGRERFRREGSALARLTHPFIARLLDAGVGASGQPYLVLEYVNGERIDDYLRSRGASTTSCVTLLLDVLDAVGHAHANLVVHRDLKPANILVTADGVVKLLDFGIARLLDDEVEGLVASTTDAARAFTPEFAAPEQLLGDVVTTATDVYALGVLLYLLITGHHPTADGCRTPAEALRALLEVQPERRGLSDLDCVLQKALKKAPAERYQAVGAFAADLRRWLRHEPVSARRATLAYRTRKLVRRHRAVGTALVAGAVLTIAYVASALADRQHVRQALAEATSNAHRAEQVTDFTVGMFGRGNDAALGADSLSARDLLTRGVARAHELSGQPATEAQMLDLIGRIRMEIGDYEGAGPVLQEALAIRRRALGDGDPDVATSLIDNAELISASGRERGAEAVPMLREALAVRQRNFGDTDPRTTDALYKLASELHMSGDYKTARPMFDQWIARIAKQPPQLTLQRSEQLGTMTRIMEFTGKTRRADSLARQLLALDQALYGARSTQVAQDLSQLGGIKDDLGEHRSADSLIRESISLLRAIYPGGTPLLANSQRDLGYVLMDENRFEEADSVWRASALEYRRYAGPTSLGYANSMSYFGYVEAELGRSVAAERILRDVLALPPIQRPAPNPVADRARAFLGEALRGEGRLTEAEPLLLAAMKDANPTGPSRNALRLAARSLVKLYEAEGRPVEAAKFRGLADRRATP
jgi:eukaryotic-like serine/threonine-protein kinase